MTNNRQEPQVGKYIDPMVDYGFKYIFKESGKKQLIIRPLNEIFGLSIVDIDIRESEQIGLTEQERKVTYDIFCETKDRQSFIIEVQIANQSYFMERAIFYTARTISKKGESGEWNYNFQPVFFLGLLNFDLRHLEPEKADPEKFIYKFSLREDETHEQMSRALRFSFMEVARFNKAKEECETFEERFLYIMKNLPTFVEKPELWDDPYFDTFMEQAEFASMTFEEQDAYIASMKQKWDYKNTMDFAKQEGRVEGLEQGKRLQALEIARRMLEGKMPIEKIVEFTGLTEKQIKEL